MITGERQKEKFLYPVPADRMGWKFESPELRLVDLYQQASREVLSILNHGSVLSAGTAERMNTRPSVWRHDLGWNQGRK